MRARCGNVDEGKAECRDPCPFSDQSQVSDIDARQPARTADVVLVEGLGRSVQ